MPEFYSKQLSVQVIDNTSGPVSLYADPDRLSQLFRNLLKNSINYTDSGGRLEITISRRGQCLTDKYIRQRSGRTRTGTDQIIRPVLPGRKLAQQKSRWGRTRSGNMQ